MIQAHATARGVRTSAQKAGLVLELIRGKDVNRALATLQFTKKTIAREIANVKRSAHLTVRVAERPLRIARVSGSGVEAATQPARARKTTAGGAAKKTAA